MNFLRCVTVPLSHTSLMRPTAEVIRVSVITPCRNELDYIEAFLHSLLQQHCDGLRVEFLIADGGSDDGTRELLQAYAAYFPELRIIDNPDGSVPAGLNQLIRSARGGIIIRMDVHTEYARDYIQQCVRVLQETAAENVGGPARTRSRSYFQAAVALAYHSAFSSGGVSFHKPDYEGHVDTVTYGCWRKETLEKLGMFDEELIRNQDDELNLRLVKAGGKIWQSPAIRSWYYPRETWAALFSQYAQYGFWKVRVIQKHRLPASFRHLVPGLLVFGLGLLGVLAPFSRVAGTGLLLLSCSYLLANLVATLAVCASRSSWIYLPVMPLVFAAYHFGYGYGFMRGIIDFWCLRRAPSRKFTQLTRVSHPKTAAASTPPAVGQYPIDLERSKAA